MKLGKKIYKYERLDKVLIEEKQILPIRIQWLNRNVKQNFNNWHNQTVEGITVFKVKIFEMI